MLFPTKPLKRFGDTPTLCYFLQKLILCHTEHTNVCESIPPIGKLCRVCSIKGTYSHLFKVFDVTRTDYITSILGDMLVPLALDMTHRLCQVYIISYCLYEALHLCHTELVKRVSVSLSYPKTSIVKN